MINETTKTVAQMKRILSMILSVALFAGCEQEQPAVITLTPGEAVVPAEGGTATLELQSNYAWTVTCSGFSVIPASGSGNATLTVTALRNPSDRPVEAVLEARISDPSAPNEASAQARILQPGLEVRFSADTGQEEVSYAGGTVTVELEANVSWTAETDPGVTVEPESGTGSARLTLTVPANRSEGEMQYTLKLVPGVEGADPLEIPVRQQAPRLTVGEDTYRIRLMADGRWWMVENLRYVPDGMSVSSDPLENGGIWYPNAGTDAARTSEAEVQQYGLLYDFFAVAGIARDGLSADPGQTYEGLQGICPQGWHIPTAAEADAFVAAYYDETQKAASLAALEADGFNPVTGGFRKQVPSNESGSYVAAMPGYYMCSTQFQYKNEDGKVIWMNRGLMKTDNGTFARINVANASNLSGISVRCIRNAE